MEKNDIVTDPSISKVDMSNGRLIQQDREDLINNYPKDKAKAAVRKVDLRLIPILFLLYMFSYLDRTNIGNAKVEGLEDSLNMTGSDYNVATSIFFVPYVLFEIPSNYVLKRYFARRPSFWIGFLCVSWGTIMTLQGVVQNFTGLVICRFFLGLAEAGYFPAAITLCSFWYLKHELSKRIAIFFTAAALSGAFSGLLAFAIAKMDGVGNYEGWRWIFILEGIVSVIMGIITFLCLPDCPETSGKWLREDEIEYLQVRMLVQDREEEEGVASSKFDWGKVKSVLLDVKVYIAAACYWSSGAPLYGISFTLPQIIKNMGYESSDVQLLSIPPYVIGAISAIFFASFSDKYNWRMPFIGGPLVIELTGFAVLFGYAAKANSVAVNYFAVCLTCIGIYPVNPLINAWVANNLAGASRRSIGIALFLTIGNCCGLGGSFFFKNSESPRYPSGFGSCVGLAGMGIALVLVLEYIIWIQNKKKAKLTEDEVYEKYSQDELYKMGDRSPLFKYTY